MRSAGSSRRIQNLKNGSTRNRLLVAVVFSLGIVVVISIVSMRARGSLFGGGAFLAAKADDYFMGLFGVANTVMAFGATTQRRTLSISECSPRATRKRRSRPATPTGA